MEDGDSKDAESLLPAVLAVLDDPDCREILRVTTEPRTPSEIAELCDLPESTLYRKLNQLTTASLLRKQVKVDSETGQMTEYVRNFERVAVSMDDNGEFNINVEKRERTAEDRLTDLWSKLGDEI
ncbi:helix-turn-helix domain-containing protein [Halolamina sp. C58]|uniref:helix-turn-helix domain-containing protein n=1 Tax=Halolamina sp. C58 TaxID=3421640 RepID=UPI003EB8C8DA